MNSPKKTGSARKIRLISIAAGSLCGLGLLNSAIAPVAFPSAIHHGNLGSEDLGADSRTRPSAFGADEISVQEMSQGQIIAQRIQHMHREGLPVAHLWESKLAALSIGLNQRGKPGLWFTQRMH